MNMRIAMSTQSSQHGSSLIEVLISLVLVAVTMLGLLGLQLRTMSLQKDSLDRRNAAILVSSLADRISGNFDGFVAGSYAGRSMGDAAVPPALTTPCVSAATCTNAEVGLRDWELFQFEVRNRLPNGVAAVALGANGAAIVVTVGWLDPQRTQEAAQLRGTVVDANSDDIDDGCAAIGVNRSDFRCYVANVFP